MRRWVAVLQALAGVATVVMGDLPPGTDAALGALVLALGTALWPTEVPPDLPASPVEPHSRAGERPFDAAPTERGSSRVGGYPSVEGSTSTEGEQNR